MKKLNIPLLLTFIILTLFTGCYNLSVDTGALPFSEKPAASDGFCCVVSGRVSTELDAAAMPASATRQVSPSGGSAASVRTALPSLNLTGEVAITAKFYDATAGIPDVTGTYDTENKTFSVPLTKEGTWTIFAKISSYSGATTVTITRDTLVKTGITLKMKPDMSGIDGNGTISLPVSIEDGTGIKTIAMSFTDSKSTVHTPDITLLSTSTTGTLNETGVAAGAYSATIRAYDTAGVLVFQCTESLLVLPDSTTNNWVISSADVTASPYLSVGEAGTVQFKITKASLENFARTSYYVAPYGDDTEEGSQGNPFLTLKKAADTIMLYNDGVSEYTLFIEDDITYSSAADAFSISLPADYTKDLKVKLTSLDGKYSINADGKTNVLKVTNSSDKKCILTVENIVLSGGKADSGAGIYFKGKSEATNANTKLILNSGAEIKDNDFIGTADVDGVGICVTNASFEMNDGSKIIGKNYSGNNLQKDWFMGGCLSLSYSKGIINGGEIRGVKISGCTKEIEGSAVYLGWSETTMYGGLITANQVTDSECIYGTLYVEAGLFTMDGGEISGNTLSGNGTVYGSGLYITDNNTSSTTCILNKGSISNNLISNTDPSTDFGGAGIFSLGSSLTINGSFNISNNFVIGSSGKGGAIYHGAGNLVINGGTFYGNFAEKGGGLYNGRLVPEEEISATISGGYFFANTATFGHGMFVSEYGSATLQGSPVFSKADYIYLQETGDDTVKTLDIGGALCTKPGYTSVATIIVNNYKEGMTVLTGPGVSSANSLFSLYDSTFGIDTEGKLKKYP